MTAPKNQPHDPFVGSKIDGRFELKDRLGAGGMGVVYRAFDPKADRIVAVKLLAPHLENNSDARRRFQREIELIASIDHEHVIELYDAGIDKGRLYFAMEYVEGADLGAVLKRGPMSLERSLEIFRQVATALQFLHEQGQVHRDVKPENVLLRSEGTPDERAVLTDFGIARLLDSATQMTIGIGTAEYMAPEIAAMRDPTPASDQYALACMLYRMLAGEHVFEGADYPRAHLDEAIPDLQERLPDAPYAVRAALRRALAKDSKDRFPSISSFAQAVAAEDEAIDRPRAQLHNEIVLALEAADGAWVKLGELTNLVNDQIGAEQTVTELQVMGRIRTFPHLFQWRGDKIALLG